LSRSVSSRQAVTALLAEDVESMADGGGKSLLRSVSRGPDRIGRLYRIARAPGFHRRIRAQNLFVVGASVYPHNAGYNPTGPLAALALRLGDDLVRYTSKPGRLS
jgi:hypothetical protein